MKLEGIEYNVYTLHVPDRTIVGVDRRPIAEVEAEWLSKAAVAARREAQVQRGIMAANMRNTVALEKHLPGGEGGRDPAYQEEHAPISPDDVVPPPAAHAESDEVLRLQGVPGGLGAVSVLASDVRAIQLAFGEDLWDVEDTIEEGQREAKRHAVKEARKNRATKRRSR